MSKFSEGYFGRMIRQAAGRSASSASCYSRENMRLRAGIAAIKQATIDGRVCDDVAWFDTITTLHDYCDQLLANEQLQDKKS